MTFRFYSDPSLTVPVTTLRYYSTEASDKLLYFGNPTGTKKLVDSAAPSVDDVLLEVADSDVPTGLAAASVKLSLTSIGLDSATGGASLNLGEEILGGAGNAKTVYIRIDTSSGTLGDDYTDVSLRLNSVIEVDI